MSYRPNYHRYEPSFGTCKPVETDITCPYCGYDVQADEPYTWTKDGQICHEECCEREDKHGNPKAR